MIALPSTKMPDGPLRAEAPIPSHLTEDEMQPPLHALIYRGTGLALILAAVGIWLIPIVSGDPMMQLVKLIISAALAMGGAAFLVALQPPAGPIVTIDPRERVIRIADYDTRGQQRMETSHAIDSLTEIELRDGLLSARAADGRALLALPIRDMATHKALVRILGKGQAA